MGKGRSATGSGRETDRKKRHGVGGGGTARQGRETRIFLFTEGHSCSIMEGNREGAALAAVLFSERRNNKIRLLGMGFIIRKGMARPIDPADAKRVIAAQQELLLALAEAENALENLRGEVAGTSDALVDREVMKLLEGIPVEEVNRGKRGFRTKTLHDHGYHTIADIASASEHTIAAINGISDDGAYSIKQIVDEIAATARQGVKIRLSEDRKSDQTTRLVVSISKLKNSEPHILECGKLYREHKQAVSDAMEALQPATNGLKWFFASGKKKKRAMEAYETLRELLNGPYGQKARGHLEELFAIGAGSGEAAWKDFSSNSIRFFNILEDINPGILGTDDTVYGLPEDLAREIMDQEFFPKGLLCELRRYQQWGVKYVLHQERVLLGDEMGLGKTIQAIAAMVSLGNTGATHFVVVCPASVLTNWCREIRKMSRLPVTKIHGGGRAAALRDWIKTGGVAVTTYETTGHFKLEEDFRFSMLVVDEAHYIKNPEAQRTRNVKRIGEHAQRLLFMTGTALENKVDEMIALIRILQPEVASAVYGMEYLSSAPQFREKVAPVYYRRRREDVLTELPELIESKEWCTLSKAEEAVYERAVLGKQYAQARRVSWNAEDLRDSSKANRMMELVEEAQSDGRKVIVFSFFLDTIGKVKKLLGSQCLGPINGSVPPRQRQEIIDAFEKAPAGTVLAAQIQAGGTGLNIQCASVVILCEPQFKPSIENQAISRAYRMGQTRNVLVYRLLCDDTVDEKITDMLQSKQAIFDAFADESAVATESFELDDKTFGNIIQEEIDRIHAKHGEAVTGAKQTPGGTIPAEAP